jgi:hypothetical protein
MAMFEILGVHPANKGARLMLSAAKERLGREYPSARFAVPYDWPADTRLAEGLWATVPRGRGRVDRADLAGLLPGRMRRRVGLAAPRDVQVILDASGFAYGDFWGLDKLRRRLETPAKRWKSDRRLHILLPQAFGPFRARGMQQAFAEAVQRVDLVFVRDRVSYDYVQEAVGPRDNVHQAPDFTNLLKAPLPQSHEHLRGLSIIIPNEKMVADATAQERAGYLDFLRTAAEALAADGRDPVILIHEGRGDRAIAEALNSNLSRPLEVVDIPSALTTKAVIGASDLVVSSRFHGLVSALSNGVPSLACGWSHKYGELMSDYGCESHSVDVRDKASWSARLDSLLTDARRPDFRSALAAKAEAQRAQSEAMWAKVFGLMRSAGLDG